MLDGNHSIVGKDGLFKPFALVDGRAAGLWTLPGGRVSLEPFGPLPAGVLAALEREARDVERFLAPNEVGAAQPVG